MKLPKALYAFIGVLYLLGATPALAGWVTELGGGYLVPSYTSYILLPECKHVLVLDPPDNPRTQTDTYSCGGHGPVALGWPIAYDFELKDGRFRIGLFHMSHWFDNNGESQLNCICTTYTHKWGRKGN